MLLGIVGVTGELLLTAGVFVFLYLGWQMYLNAAIIANDQSNQALEASRQWAADSVGARLTGTLTAASSDGDAADAVPVYSGSPSNSEVFATLIVPRFGADWTRPIAEGIGATDVLNAIGVGHYPGSSMPGALGNFAVAAHRTGWGNPFIDINQLMPGDSIYVATPDGWYRYVYRSHEYVYDTQVEVLAAVPQVPDAAATDRFLTLTSCNPLYSASERYIAYSVLDSFQPIADGPPEEIAHLYGVS